MLGTIVNTVAVLVGGALGLLFKKAIPKRLSDTVFKGLGLCTLFIGITGVFQDGVNTLVVIMSVVLGAVIGEAIDLDKRVNTLGNWIENKFNKNENENGKISIAQGFVSASLLFCVGAMTIVGSLQSGLANDHTTLFTKSILDFVAAIIFASSLGVGVLFSAIFVFMYQGVMSFGAYLIGSFFSGSADMLAQTSQLTPFMVTVNTMNCAGYIIIVGLALNMIGITKLKVMNYVPAIFMPILFCPLADFIMTLI
ncbi:MAG: DUF554 domain-containing protein [Ruminococcaceae bacterium]|nr:DUF554 domain-containing protein [Oscillospiraceae bacterium]